MKKYVIEVIEDENGLHMTRTNQGFNIHELLGFIEETKQDLFSYMTSMKKSEMKKRIKFDSGKKKGEIIK